MIPAEPPAFISGSTWRPSGRTAGCPHDVAAGVDRAGGRVRTSAGELLAAQAPDRALRGWMDRFADYATAKREMADALRAVFASGAVTMSQAREELTAAVQAILAAGTAAGTLRDDVRSEDIVATVVGMFAATSLAGGREQLERMLDLLMDAVRRPGPRARPSA